MRFFSVKESAILYPVFLPPGQSRRGVSPETRGRGGTKTAPPRYIILAPLALAGTRNSTPLLGGRDLFQFDRGTSFFELFLDLFGFVL